MAIQQYGIKYRVGFETDQASLQKTVNEAISALQKIGTNSQFGVAKELQDASSAAYKLGSILKGSINMETGKFEIDKFQQKLQQSGMTLEQYRDKLAQLGPQGKNAFGQVADAITSAELPMRRVNTLLDKLWATMKNTIRWQFTSRAWMTLLSSIRTAYSYSQDLNESLNKIRIVTGHNADEMARFAENANKAAAKLNTTTTEYTDASRIYFQQGLDDAEVERRTAVTIKLANAAGISAEQASSQLTAIWNNFSDGSDNLERYADVLVKLGATTASSSEEISKGMQKFAAVADTVGLSYDYAASALATIVAETRTSAEEVGTSLRTIFARFESLKLGETLEDGVDLNKYTAALANVGVNVLDSNGELRQMDDILDDIFKKWQNLNQAQLNALATTVAGVRQYANFIALFKNADTFYQNVETAQGATGALQEQADIYAQSWEAAKDQVKNAAQDIYDSLINADFFIDFDNNILAPLLHGIASVIDGFGGLKGLLPTIAGYLTMIFGPQITSFMDNFAYNLRVISGIEAQRARDLQAEAMQLKAGMAVDTGDTTEQERVGIENQVLKLKTEILQTSTQYSEAQQEAIRTQANLIDELIAQWKEAAKQAKEYEDTVEYTKSNLSKKVEEKLPQALQAQGIKVKEGQTIAVHKQLSKNDPGKYYTRPEALQGYKGQSDSDVTSFFLGKDTKTIKQQIQQEINVIEEELKQLEDKAKLGIKVDDGYIKGLKASLKEAQADLEALNNITVAPKIDVSQLDLTESEKILEEGSILNLKLNLEATDAKGKVAEILGSVDKLKSLFQQLGTREGGLGAIRQQFAQLDTSTKLSKEEVETLSAEFKQLGLNPDQFVHEGDTIQQVLDQISQATQETKTVNEEWIQALGKVAETDPVLKGLLTNLKQVAESSRQAGQATIKAAGAYHQAANGVVVLAKKSEEADKQVKSFSQQTTMAIQGITAGLGAVTAFSSSIKILGDSSADATAKFGAVRSMVYSAIPAINSLGKAIEGIKNKTAVAGGWITIVITVLATLISVLSEAGVFKTPFEKAAESVKKYKEELEDLNNSIESNEKELETMQKRMKELEAIKVPSLAEAEELENLRVKNNLLAYQTEELKRQRKETQKLLAAERKRMAESGSDAMSDAVRSKRGGFFADVGDFITGSSNESQAEKWVNQKTYANFMEDQQMGQIEAYWAIQSGKYNKELKAAREQALLEYRQEFRETEQTALQDFQDYVELQTELGLKVEEEQVQLLARTMKNYWLEDFEAGYVGPVLSALSQNHGEIVEALIKGTTLSDKEKQQLLTSGLTVEDTQEAIDKLREKFATVTGGEHWLQNLTGKQISYILTIDWQGKTPAEIQQEVNKHFAEISDEAQAAAASILAYDKATHQTILDKITATKDLTDKELEYLQALEKEYDLLNLLSGDRSSGAYQRELFNIQNLEEARNIVGLGTYVDAATSAALDEYNAATQAKEEAESRKNDAYIAARQTSNEYHAALRQQPETKEIKWNWSNDQQKELQELVPGIVGMMRAQLDNRNLSPEDVVNNAKNYLLDRGQSFEDTPLLSTYIESILQDVEKQALDAEQVVENALKDTGELIVDASVEAAKSFEKATEEYKEATDTYFEAVDNQNKAAEKLENVNINFKELVKNAQEFGAALAADVATDFSYIQGQFNSFAKAEETLASSSTYTWEQMQTIAQAYPDILAAATVTSEGIWTLNEETAESAKESAKAQVMAEIDAAIHKSNLAVQYYQRQVDIYDDLIEAFSKENATEEDLKEAYSKSIISIDQAEKETRGAISNALAQSVNADEDSMAQAAVDDSTIYSNSWVKAYQEVQKAYEDLVKARIAGDQAMVASAQENFDLATQKAAKMKKTTASLLASQTADSHVAEGDWTFGYKGGIDEWLAKLGGTPEEREQARKAALASFKALRESAAGSLADEKIYLSGLYALKNSYSTGDFSTDKSKKSGSGSKSSAKEKEALKWQLERYHEISREIAYQERQVNKLDKTISRAYGANKLQAFADKEKALNKQLTLEQEKLQEASEKWLEADKAALEELSIGVQFNAETGEISNYSEIMTAAADAQQKAIDEYNARQKAGASETELEELQKAIDATADRMTEITDAIKNYEDSLTEVAEQQEKIAEIERQIADNRIASFDAALQLKLDVQSIKDAANELNKALIQSNGDMLDYGIDLLSAREKDFDGLIFNIKSRLQYARQLTEELRKGEANINTTDVMSKLQDVISSLMQDAQSALEFITEWEKEYSEAVNAAMERFNWYVSRLSHNSSVASTIKELLTLQGVTNKTADGFGKLQKVLQTQLDAAITQGKLQKDAYDYWTAQVAIANENWNSVKDNVDDINYDRYKNDLQAVIAQQEAAEDAMLASAKESMELARTMYEEQLERAKIEFEQIMTDGSSISELQKQFDHFIDENERYFDEVNTAFHIADWQAKLQADIDNTTNAAHRQQLQLLQEEIETRAEGGKLNQYDLDILNAKYNQMQALMALEDARNNKNTLRLVRDSQGNWNYQYTNNADDVAAQEQKLAQANNEYYNIAKQQTQDVTSQIISLWQECEDEVNEIFKDSTLTEEERNAKVAERRAYYAQKAADLEREKAQAIADMTAAATAADIEFSNSYIARLSEMTTKNVDFEANLDTLLNKCSNYYNDFSTVVAGVAEDTGTNISSLDGYTNNLAESTRNFGDDAKEAWGKAKTALEEYAEVLNDLVPTMEIASQTAKNLKVTGDAAAEASEQASGLGYHNEIVYDQLGAYAKSAGASTGVLRQIYNERQMKISANPELSKYSMSWEEFLQHINGLTKYQVGNVSDATLAKFKDWLNLMGIQSLATGGYTGDFSDGRLALLHEKELVLNSQDTRNILTAVALTRQMAAMLEAAIDGSANAGLALMRSRFGERVEIPALPGDQLEQMIHIDQIEFPNVTTASEIQEAFRNLADNASQWARRRKS